MVTFFLFWHGGRGNGGLISGRRTKQPSSGIPLANVLLGRCGGRLVGHGLERRQAWAVNGCRDFGRFTFQQLPAIPQQGFGLVESGQILRIRRIVALLMQL